MCTCSTYSSVIAFAVHALREVIAGVCALVIIFVFYLLDMSVVYKAQYHPFLYTVITLCASAELGLTGYLIDSGNEHRTWPTHRYHHLLIFSLFNAVWTTTFAGAYVLWLVGAGSQLLAGVASSVIWTAITSSLWGAAAGLMWRTRTGGGCNDVAPITRCRESLTVEAIGWTELGLCLILMLATCISMVTGKRVYVVDSQRMV